MKRGATILIISAAVLIILLVLAFIMLTSSSTVKAQINVEQGVVSVNQKQIEGTSNLKQGDVIETAADGLATVILYESIVINLEESTKILLDDLAKEHPSVSLESGSTFSQITKLFGINSYTEKSGNSVASVRGTSFIIENDKILVGDGTVEYELDNKQFTVVEGRVVEKLNGQLIERNLTAAEKERLHRLELRAIDGLKLMRDSEMNKHPWALNLIKMTYGLNESSIQHDFEKADNDELNLSEFKDKSPVNLDSIDKIIAITDKIKELTKRLK
jgi:hypothetical protein